MLDFKAEKQFKNFKYSVSFKTESSVTALFAPSGSGKSLTLKVISGLLKPDRGEVLLNGKVLFSSEKGINLPPQRRRIGFLFQDYALFPHMTVWENITYASKDLKLSKRLLELLEIEQIKDKYPKQISGGERQRVALARALSTRPELLLLDEPFSALHKTLKESLYGELKRIIDEFGIPVVLVTHDVEEVFRLAQSVVVLDRGKVVQTGKPDEVFFSPKNVKVAKLFGHKNFLKGTVLKNEKDFTVVKVGRDLIKCRRSDLKSGEEVTISILPIAPTISPQLESVKIKVLVEEIEELKGFNLIRVDYQGNKMELSVPSALSPNFILERGRETELHLAADYISVIKEESVEEKG